MLQTYVFIFGHAGSSLLHGLPLVAVMESYSLVVVCGLLTVVDSPVEQGLRVQGLL